MYNYNGNGFNYPQLYKIDDKFYLTKNGVEFTSVMIYNNETVEGIVQVIRE